MAEIIFFDSMGTNEKLPSAEWLKDKVFNGGDSFWEGATGECAISFANDLIAGTMILIGRENNGFLISHRYSQNDELFQTLRSGDHTGETVEAETGGNLDLYFKEYFVPKKIAWQAIEHFIKTGERHPNLIWETAEIVQTD